MRYVTAVLLTLVMTVAAGCGLAGKAVEKATGVSVDKDKNSVTYKGQDGQQVTVSSNEAGKLPEGFPLPLYNGGKVTSSAVINSDNKKSWTLEIQMNAEPKDVADYYEPLLKDRGVKVSRIDAIDHGEGSIMLMGESDKESGMLTISRTGSKQTTLTIIWSSK